MATIHRVIGIQANVISVLLISVILTTLCEIRLRKTVHGHSALEVVPTLLTSLMGLFYETVSSGKADFVLANVISLVMFISYLAVYCRYSSSRIRVFIGSVAIAWILVIGLLSVTFNMVPHEWKPLVRNVTGGLYLISSITAFATPVGVNLWKASRKQHITSLSGSLSGAACIHCMIWILYATTGSTLDIITLISNVTGLIVNGFQCYLWYRTSRDWSHILDGNILPSLFKEE